MVWLIAPKLIAKNQEGIGSIGRGGDGTKVPGADPSCSKLVFSKFRDIFEKPGTLPERFI